MVQVETTVKNKKYAEVEAVNFVKVELKEEIGENILRAPRRPQSILLQRC